MNLKSGDSSFRINIRQQFWSVIEIATFNMLAKIVDLNLSNYPAYGPKLLG